MLSLFIFDGEFIANLIIGVTTVAPIVLYE